MATKKVELEKLTRGEGVLGKAKDYCPIFVLVATDPLAAEAVEWWATMARVLGVPNNKVQEAYAIAEQMAAYNRHHSKIPD